MATDAQAQTTATGKTAIVVDEHPLIIEAMKSLITQHTSVTTVLGARSPDDALRLLAQRAGDVLTTELSFTGGSGLDLLASLRAQYPHVRTLVVSAQADPTAALRCIQLGAYGFVRKSADLDMLIDAIQRTLEGQTSMDAELSRAFEQVSTESDASLRHDPLIRLSRWEYDVYLMIGKGMSSREIADATDRSLKTIETYKMRIKQKLGLSSSMQLARHAFAQAN